MKKLGTLYPAIRAENAQIEVGDITLDSRSVKQGSLFLAVKGQKCDARQWIQQAVDAGAAAVFAEKEGEWQRDCTIQNIPVVVIENLAEKVGEIASRFYQQPSEKLHVCAVTGTNGKTSSSHLLASALTTLGHKAGVLGTLGNGVYGALEQSTHTTLDACTLQRSFAGFVENGVEFACIEASSHGLVQGRLNGTRIELALFTNLTRDHLDYHGTMENYAAAKEILFRWPNLKHAVLNADDSQSTHYKNVLSQSVKCWTYSVHPESHADIVALKIAPSLQGITLSVSTPIGVCDVKVALLGRFNVSNLLAVMAALIALDFSLEDIQSAFLALKPVRGRMECFMGDHPTVVVDYAHTPDALEKVLSNLREHAEGKLICVFGCGGDRDSGKRPVMGRIAYQLADYVVLTSDNPRTESPESILKEILAGMPADASIVVEANRHQAIAQAIAKAGAADIVLVAGKGHEDYQEVMGIRHHFDDAEEVRAALALWRAA